MSDLEIQLPCAFGLEAVAAREVKALGYDDVRTVNGRVLVRAGVEAIPRLNVFVRTADRVQVVVGRFSAIDFGELFERTKELDWRRWLGGEARFPVTGRSVRSQLLSVPTCQKMVKKAVATSLAGGGKAAETGVEVPVHVALLNDEATLSVDTTGPGLHKRGYRTHPGKASLRETLASALVQLSYWNRERPLLDPCCGSGTILIEAVWWATNRAPGMTRDFIGEPWPAIGAKFWSDAREEAHDLHRPDVVGPIVGSDIDGRQIHAAGEAVHAAGLADVISLERRPLAETRMVTEYGCLITNPPYGNRLLGEDEVGLDEVYDQIGRKLRELSTWSTYVLSGYDGVERAVGKKADRRRKLYNATIEATLYSWFGPRPPRAA